MKGEGTVVTDYDGTGFGSRTNHVCSVTGLCKLSTSWSRSSCCSSGTGY